MGFENGCGENLSQDLVLEYVSWLEIHEALIDLSKKIINDGHRFDAIIAIAKGGFIPARIVSDLLGIEDIGVIAVKFYKKAGVQMAKPRILHSLTIDVYDKAVLIVDDVVDSGRTLQLVLEEAYRHGARKVKTLALYVKPWTTMKPDYFYKTTKNWVVFPWELLEVYRELGGKALENLNVQDREKTLLNRIMEFIKILNKQAT